MATPVQPEPPSPPAAPADPSLSTGLVAPASPGGGFPEPAAPLELPEPVEPLEVPEPIEPPELPEPVEPPELPEPAETPEPPEPAIEPLELPGPPDPPESCPEEALEPGDMSPPGAGPLLPAGGAGVPLLHAKSGTAAATATSRKGLRPGRRGREWKCFIRREKYPDAHPGAQPFSLRARRRSLGRPSLRPSKSERGRRQDRPLATAARRRVEHALAHSPASVDSELQLSDGQNPDPGVAHEGPVVQRNLTGGGSLKRIRAAECVQAREATGPHRPDAKLDGGRRTEAP